MTKISNSNLKKFLSKKTKQALINDILDLHKTNKKLQDYYSIEANKNNIIQIFNDYKEDLSEEFNTLIFPDMNFIQKKITKFKSISNDNNLVIDLMIYVVTNYLDYTNCIACVNIDIFDETNKQYFDLLSYIFKNKLEDHYKQICSDIALSGDSIQEALDGSMIQIYINFYKPFYWDDYINNQLSFPFNVSINDQYEDNIFTTNDILKVISVESYDDLYGLILKVKQGRKIFYLPSIETSVLDTSSLAFKHMNQFEKCFSEKNDNECMINEVNFFKKIKNFESEINNFSYHSQLIWEHGEEVEYGDDSWINILEELMETSIELFHCKHYKTAYESFKSLINIYSNEELIYASEINDHFSIDVDDFFYKYLISAYMYFDNNTRADQLVNIIHENCHVLEFSLKNMLFSYKGTLPKIKPFTEDFISSQKALLNSLNKNSFNLDNSLKIYIDSLFYKNKEKNTKPFVLECVSKYPKAFYYYILNLITKSKDKIIVETCLEALNVIPANESIRDDISKLMMTYAKKTNNSHLISHSKLESFISNSSEENLIQLFEDQHLNKKTNIKEATLYIKNQQNKINTLIKIHILLGEFDQALKLEINNKNCDPNHRLIYLKLLTKNKQCKIIDLLFTKDTLNKYNNLLIDIIDKTDLSDQIKESLSDYCKNTIINFTIDIVSNQNRNMYKAAAYEIIACFEMLMIINNTENAYNFYNIFKQKFPKHSAFQCQLENALKISKSI